MGNYWYAGDSFLNNTVHENKRCRYLANADTTPVDADLVDDGDYDIKWCGGCSDRGEETEETDESFHGSDAE